MGVETDAKAEKGVAPPEREDKSPLGAVFFNLTLAANAPSNLPRERGTRPESLLGVGKYNTKFPFVIALGEEIERKYTGLCQGNRSSILD
ncbi:hypothetical protein JTE90_006750 [Oedothorax gibbosus]|uniref:Uncharacterized protein n=1 Tax=Oedothorax gibbosus TaxID=931172 RepID=A0AAV6UJD1_9ARAC|nr:hypothetical protein JTE90_006750 [Oedothorax gibbosus]